MGPKDGKRFLVERVEYMSGDVEISVIIPAYNIEAYIEKCVDSVLNQSFQYYEIIIIDDGSCDGTAKICDDYEKYNDNIRVLHQNNLGVVRARKEGLKVAKGKYISFVDGDDWIEQDTLQKMYTSMLEKEVDIVAAGYIRDYQGTQSIVLNGIEENLYQVCDEIFLESAFYSKKNSRNGLDPSLCSKLLRRDILLKCMDEMDESIHYAEDLLLLWQYLMKAKNIYVLSASYYHYMQHEGSCMHTYDPNFYEQINKVYIKLKQLFEENKLWETLKVPLGSWFFKQILIGLNGKFDFGFSCNIPEYYFDNSQFDKTTKIILYGAGRVGKGYHTYICNTKCVELVAWVDKNSENDEMRDLGVIMPERIHHLSYDYILIATLYENQAIEIKKKLVEQGIIEKKILWLRPQNYI